jgi:hypothetical protein
MRCLWHAKAVHVSAENNSEVDFNDRYADALDLPADGDLVVTTRRLPRTTRLSMQERPSPIGANT